jgi:tryptophan 2-monooxygenase
VDKLRLESLPFPNPLTPAGGSTVIDLWGETQYAQTLDDLPPLFHEVAAAYGRAQEDGAKFSDLKAAIRDR